VLPPVVLLLAVGGLFVFAEEPPTRGVQGPASLPELDEALGRTASRLQDLVECAEKDPLWRKVELYRDYTVEQFADPKRTVKAEDLLDIMIDEDLVKDLRDAAFKVLTSKEAMQFDPDLVLMGRGRRKPRAAWCRSKVVRLLKDREDKTRAYAHELLKIYFKGAARASVVVMYDPYNGDPKQWGKAIKHWNKALQG
jgi:hypothetical protein